MSKFNNCSLVPYRNQSTDVRAQVVQPGPREPYSPHQTPDNNVDFLLARADDLLNYGRRVHEILKPLKDLRIFPIFTFDLVTSFMDST